MHRSRLWLATVLFLVPAQVSGQILSGDQDARVKGIIGELSREVERCSLTHNAANREGPVKLHLELDSRGRMRVLTVMSKLTRTDFGRCVAKYKVSKEVPSATFQGGKSIRLEFQFHPWAGRQKRTWKQVRQILRDTKVENALYECIKSAGKDRPKEVSFAMAISMKGEVAVDPDETSLGQCFAAAVAPATFEPSQNHYRVEYKWGRSWKPTKATGFVTEPKDCEVAEYPCTWAEADPTRVNLANKYFEELGKKIDCSKPEPAIAWLEKQKHVRWVEADGCAVNMLVEGSRPMSFFYEK